MILLKFVSFRMLVFASVGLLVSCEADNSTAGDATPPSVPPKIVVPVSIDTVKPPDFSPAAGIYSGTQVVTLTSSTYGAEIRYTTDGSAPTTSSIKYVSPLLVDSSQTLKAIAVKSGMEISPVALSVYTIHRIPVTAGTLAWGGQTYKTVKVGDQTWMAENLYAFGSSPSIGACYKGPADTCRKYGSLFTWTEAMNLPDSCDISICTNLVNLKHRGICPVNWHVPTDSDWNILLANIGSDKAGTKLKSKNGWSVPYGASTGNGSDDIGFTVLPTGYFTYYDQQFKYFGSMTFFWNANETSPEKAGFRSCQSGRTDFVDSDNYKDVRISLRCLAD